MECNQGNRKKKEIPMEGNSFLTFLHRTLIWTKGQICCQWKWWWLRRYWSTKFAFINILNTRCLQRFLTSNRVICWELHETENFKTDNWVPRTHPKHVRLQLLEMYHTVRAWTRLGSLGKQWICKVCVQQLNFLWLKRQTIRGEILMGTDSDITFTISVFRESVFFVAIFQTKSDSLLIYRKRQSENMA